jgi:hypothetical protein
MSSDYDGSVRQIDLILGETTSNQVERIFHDDSSYRFGWITPKNKSKIQKQGPGFPKKALDNATYFMQVYPSIMDALIFDREKKLIVASISFNELPLYVTCRAARNFNDMKQKNIRRFMRQYGFSELYEGSSNIEMRSNINPCVVVDATINRERNKIRRIDYMFVCPTRSLPDLGNHFDSD